ESKATAIVKGNDLDKMTYDELRGKLLAYESASNKTQDNKIKGMAFKSKVNKFEDEDLDEEMMLFAESLRKIVMFKG
ncbi:hypothetical protein PIB30_100645, partial [Stylosanthes scabra]|nr:hypothetical protein [Stylosanthes scabra]